MAKQIDMLSGSLWRSVLRFSVPVAATSILEQLTTFIGVLIIGRFSGDHAAVGMAALGANMPLVSFIVSLSMGIALGANVIVAIALGRKNLTGVERAVHTSIALSVFGLVFTLLGELLAVPLLKALCVPDEAFAETLIFWRIYLISVPAIALFNFEFAIYRSIGNTIRPLQVLTVATVLNAVLGYVFVAICSWGVAGIAVATVASYVLCAILLLADLCRIDSAVRVSLRKIKIDWSSARQIIKVGLPAGVQMGIFAVANIIIQGAINSLGTNVIAASSAGLSLEFVFWAMVSAFGQACTSFTGQNFGAGDIKRCKKTLLVCMVESEIVVAVIVLAVIFLGREMVGLFNGDPEVVSLGYQRLFIIIPSYFFSMVYETCSDYMRGFGISVSPAALTVLGVCGVRVLWVAFVFPAFPTFEMIMYVYPVSLGITAILIVALLMIARPSKNCVNL